MGIYSEINIQQNVLRSGQQYKTFVEFDKAIK